MSVVLCLALAKGNKDISLLLSLTVCSLVAIAAMSYLHPVVDFFRKLKGIGQLDPELFGILLKAVGIGILSEISGQICEDSGNKALGKTLQLLAAVVVLWLSIPLFDNLMDLLQKILEAI